MSENLTYPAEGVSQLSIKTLARDAIVRGAPGASSIQITFAAAAHEGGPAFIPEGSAVRFTRAAAVRVLAPETLTIVVHEALGDLRVQGLSGQIRLEAVRGDLRLVELAGQVTLAQADGDIRAEGVADLHIEGACHGDLRFIDGGLLAAEAIAGDLRIANATAAQVGNLHGDLWVEKLSGALTLHRADGDARLSDIAGPITVQALSGDLRGEGLTGGFTAEKVRGDLSLSGPFPPGSAYSLMADGDILLNLPTDADVRLMAQARGRIRSAVTLTPSADGAPSFSAILGQGSCRITARSQGDLRINHQGETEKAGRWERRTRRGEDPFSDLSNLGDRIRQQVAASLASAGINIETGETTWGWTHSRRGRSPAPAERPKPPAPPRTNTEEQLAILKMVEEGRITPEEAEQLLKALGG